MRVQFLCSFEIFRRNSGRYPSENSTYGQKQDRFGVARLIISTIKLRHEDEQRLLNGEDCRIDCSAEEFVRFQIKRRDLGYINRFRDLKVRVISDPPVREPELPLFVSMGRDFPIDMRVSNFYTPPKPTIEDVVSTENWTPIDLGKFEISAIHNTISIRRKKS